MRGQVTPADPDRVIRPISVIRSLGVPPPCVYDINHDHVVNTVDLTVLLANFGAAIPPFGNGDLDGNGFVNTADLVVLLSKFGTACP